LLVLVVLCAKPSEAKAEARKKKVGVRWLRAITEHGGVWF
jgi:hypothetical protein